MHRSSRWALVVVAVGGALGLGGAAAAASVSSVSTSRSHGAVQVWVTPGKGAVEQILLTGVIADHGTATSIDKNGTADKNGKYVKVALARGSFEVNAVALNRRLDKLQPTVSHATCSVWATGSGNVTLFDGAGAYADISGTIRMTTSFAAIFPRYTSGAKRGQCNLGGAPSAQFQGQLVGVGNVSF
jgi:hypothetical protein